MQNNTHTPIDSDDEDYYYDSSLQQYIHGKAEAEYSLIYTPLLGGVIVTICIFLYKNGFDLYDDTIY